MQTGIRFSGGSNQKNNWNGNLISVPENNQNQNNLVPVTNQVRNWNYPLQSVDPVPIKHS